MRSTTGSRKSTSPTEASDLGQFRAAYEKADAFCKEVQSFASMAGIPASNELRYAGHHLIVALADDGSVKDSDQLTRAMNHAKRACYEAGEAGILFALDRIDVFKNDYSTINVTGVVKNYVEILQAAQAAKTRVIAGRDHVTDGAADHADYIEHFRKLAPLCDILEIARVELNKVLADQGKTTRRWVIGIALTAIFGLIAATIGIVNLLKPAPVTPPAAENTTQ